MARRIVVTSGKGGVGKTTITANLGYYLAKRGFRVALIDLDIGLNNLDVAMNIENKVVFDIIDVIEGRCRIKQALLQNDRYPSLYVLPSSHSGSKNNITAQNVKILIEKMNIMFDYILIDSPAGIENGFQRAVGCVDEAIIVCTPHISSIRDADKVINILQSYDLLSLRLVVNRLRGDLVIGGEMMNPLEIISLLKIKPLGIIPDEDKVAVSQVGDFSRETAMAFQLLADNLHNGTEYMYDCEAKYRGFWGKLKINLRRN